MAESSVSDHSLYSLEPAGLWQQFQMFCDVPRASWHEAAILERIQAWADEKGLAHEQDDAGNLLIRKPASPGREAAPTVALQAHVDMVAEADADTGHDFLTDPIRPRIESGWVQATGTTLGADNGIGAAAALAVLDDPAIEHGPLEVLLTVAEEVSLVGAARLEPGWLKAEHLLNLDTEEAGDVCIGCAGGANVCLDEQLATEALPEGHQAVTIWLTGLTGGHSGMDIHTGRASANHLMARLLAGIEAPDLRLVGYDGGRMDNAITRAATVTIGVPASSLDELDAHVRACEEMFRAELAGIDDHVTLAVGPGAHDSTAAVDADASARVISLLATLPFGPAAMSQAAPGTVETSNNIGVVQLEAGRLTAQLMVRSLVDEARDTLADEIANTMREAGFSPDRQRGYPGWAPDPDSPLLARFHDIHEQTTGQPPRVVILHAGLECGLIKSKYPDLDMISFGPTIRGAHSPSERVEIASVGVFYTLLADTLTELAR